MNTLVLIAYAALVAAASLRPAGSSSLDPWDKLLHFLTYAVFAALACRAVREKRRLLYACLGIVAYGGLMEVLQSFMPGRVMSGYDFLANTLGVVAGALAMQHLARIRARGWRGGGRRVG